DLEVIDVNRSFGSHPVGGRSRGGRAGGGPESGPLDYAWGRPLDSPRGRPGCSASIASRFTDELIEAILDAGGLSDPAPAKYLTDVIIKRRDKVVAYWIVQTNPLDRFAVARTAAGADLTFDNAAVRARAAQPAAAYKVRWTAFDNAAGTKRAVG